MIRSTNKYEFTNNTQPYRVASHHSYIRKYSYLVLLVFYSLFIITYSFAQTAKVTLDTTSMRLGEQAHLNLSLTVPANSQYSFPAIPGDTIHKLEIIQQSKIDTVKSPDGKTETF